TNGQEPRSGGIAEPCGDAPGAARLHFAMARQVVPDRAPGDREWITRGQRAGRGAAGRIAGGAPWRTVSADQSVRRGGQAESRSPGEEGGEDQSCQWTRPRLGSALARLLRRL